MRVFATITDALKAALNALPRRLRRWRQNSNRAVRSRERRQEPVPNGESDLGAAVPSLITAKGPPTAAHHAFTCVSSSADDAAISDAIRACASAGSFSPLAKSLPLSGIRGRKIPSHDLHSDRACAQLRIIDAGLAGGLCPPPSTSRALGGRAPRTARQCTQRLLRAARLHWPCIPPTRSLAAEARRFRAAFARQAVQCSS